MTSHTSPTTPKPFTSWIKKEVIVNNEVIGWYWDSPIAMPTESGKIFVWVEETLEWKEYSND
jgi:hypothetical protein